MAELSGTRVLVTGGTSGLGPGDGASARAGGRPGGRDEPPPGAGAGRRRR